MPELAESNCSTRTAAGRQRAEVSGSHVLGGALDFIGGEKHVMEYLAPHLSDVVVTRDVDGAIAVLNEAPRTRVATMDGVFFDGSGRILISSADDIDMTLLEFDAKITELAESIGDLTKRAHEQSQRKDNLVQEKAKLAATATRLKGELRQTESGRDDAVEVQRECEVALARVREKLAALDTTVAEAALNVAEIQARLREEPDGKADGDDVEMTDEELTRMENRAVELEREKESIGETAARIRLEIATASGEIATSMEKLKNLELLDGELKELIRTREEDAVRRREEIVVAEKEITESRREIAEQHGRVDTVEREIEQVKSSHGEIRARCEAWKQS